MIDAIRFCARHAQLGGSAILRNGEIRLNNGNVKGAVVGTVGTASFGTIAPLSKPVWLSAEITGNFDQVLGSIRVRFGTDTELYYLDESDSLKLKRVTDNSSWNNEYCSPLALASLDLWPHPELRIVVGLVATAADRNPVITGINVVASFPVWEGAVAQAVRRVASIVASIRPVLLHNEVVTEAKNEWRLGKPRVESGHELTSLSAIVIGGVIRTGVLDNGIVRLNGAPAQPGQSVSIAVAYRPQTTVRRVQDVRVVQELPIFIVDDLVRGGGTNGTLPSLHINGLEVRRRMVHLRIQVRGAAARQADAFAMRAAMQDKFGGTELIILDSGRTLGAAMMDVVELTGSGVDSTPVAVGIIQCPFEEFTGYKRVAAARRTVIDNTGPTPIVTVVTATNSVTISHPAEAHIEQTIDSSSVSPACTGR